MVDSAPATTLLLPIKPSRQVTKAAQAAAASPHALVNLIRLIRFLDGALPERSEGLKSASGDALKSQVDLRRDWETIQYARVLLDSLRSQNEQSSTTISTLVTLDQTLRSVDQRYRDLLSSQSTTPNDVLNPHHFPGTKAPTAICSPEASPPLPIPTFTTLKSRTKKPSTSFIPIGPSRPGVRQRRIPLDYLEARLREDEQGGEIGLLPLRSGPGGDVSARESLLGSDGGAGGVGAAQLHEELGGQLADMSHRLKLNAVHFASSLAEEKALLDTSTLTLEDNLASTRSSKKDLSTVSRKGRGTTCLTLGVVVFVTIVFVWTYMLIRFT